MPGNVREIERSLCGPGGPFETVEESVLGERLQVFRHRATSLKSLLELSASFGARDYIVYEDRRLTYVDHLRAVVSTAQALQQRYGVRKGDRVAILAANNPEWIITFWATVSLGAVAVGLNGWWVGEEILHGLEDSRPRVLVADRKRLDRISGARLSIPVVEIEHDFTALLSDFPGGALPSSPLAEDDPACILYTSGTTARPKGVINTHRNILGLIGIQTFHGLRALLSRGTPPPAIPAMLVTSPLFHVSGLYAGAVISLATGIKSVWMKGRFDPVRAMRLIQDERVSNWGPMGTVAHRFAHHPQVGAYDLSSVASFGSGGAPMSRQLQERLCQVFPAARDSAAVGYGLTECTALATLNFGEELRERPHSAGRPLPTVELEIRDPHGRPVREGEEGEICLRGPTIMLGYWQRPDETRQTLAAGRWLRTGDIGRCEGGTLVINSRARDLILRGAENISPAEIESRLLEHPQVAEAAVVGVDHEELGQEVKAVVVPQAGAVLAPGQLHAWVAERLAYYKVPAHWEIRREPLPRNAVGKVMKHFLSEDARNPFTEDE